MYKKYRISIEVEVDDDVDMEEIEKKLPFLFCDAFGEFTRARHMGDEEAYVRERYPLPDYGWLDKEEKVKSTKLRNRLAESLRQAGAKHEVEVGPTVMGTCPKCPGNYLTEECTHCNEGWVVVFQRNPLPKAYVVAKTCPLCEGTNQEKKCPHCDENSMVRVT